jgi:hypothetical protein
MILLLRCYSETSTKQSRYYILPKLKYYRPTPIADTYLLLNAAYPSLLPLRLAPYTFSSSTQNIIKPIRLKNCLARSTTLRRMFPSSIVAPLELPGHPYPPRSTLQTPQPTHESLPSLRRVVLRLLAGLFHLRSNRPTCLL